MDNIYDVVDLGTKKGGAIREFFRKGDVFTKSGIKESCRPIRCVGYEREEGKVYGKDVEARGYQFRIANLATKEGIEQLPKARVYLAWHFLEHVPDKTWSSQLVKASLDRCQDLAWFRLPSFEQDEDNGEGVLRKHGMRFTWTHWRGHTSHWLVEDCVRAISDWGSANPDRHYTVFIKPADKIESISNRRVVPIDAPIDSQQYDPSMGEKPKVDLFDPPVVAAWEVAVSFDRHLK